MGPADTREHPEGEPPHAEQMEAVGAPPGDEGADGRLEGRGAVPADAGESPGPGRASWWRRRRAWLVAGAFVALILLPVAYGAVTLQVYNSLARAEPGGGSAAANTPDQWRITSGDRLAENVSAYQFQTYENVSFSPRGDPDLRLAAWWVEAAPEAPALIIVHGIRSCKCSSTILMTGHLAHQSGYSVLMLDLRDHGESDVEDGRVSIGTREYRDVLGAWDWLQAEQGLEAARIGIVGMSMGAGTTLIAFAQEPEVAAIWVDSGYLSLRDIIEEELTREGYPTWLGWGGVQWARVLAGDDVLHPSPEDAIAAAAGRPIGIVHGDADDRVFPHHSQALAERAGAAGANVTAWWPAGVTHVDAVFAAPLEYQTRLDAFFAAHLA